MDLIQLLRTKMTSIEHMHSARPAASASLHMLTPVASSLLRRLRVHQESNINPNSDCGFIYGYYWWIFCLNFLAWCGAHPLPPCLLTP